MEQGVEEKNIVLYGESLGTGIASEIAQNKNFAGVILETPFTLSLIHISEPTRRTPISYAVFCLKKERG